MMTMTSLKVPVIAIALLAGATAPAYADDLDPPPGPVGTVEVGPQVEIGPAVDPFLDDLVDMVSEGSELAPPPN